MTATTPGKTNTADLKTAAEHRIAVRGARTNILRNIDVDLPHHSLVVLTGPSGCGKSSLAIDTVFAEGQRQYLETLSPYARQFINELPRPDVDSIDGLLPSVRIDQHQAASNPRSTVATVSEVYDYLRVLLVRAGEILCHQCGHPVRQQSISEIAAQVRNLPEGTKFIVLAPMVRGRKGQHAGVLQSIRRERLVRVRIDGTIYDIDECPPLETRKPHTIEAITDRLVNRPGIETRLHESLTLAIRMTGRLVTISAVLPAAPSSSATEFANEKTYSTQLACSLCDISYPEMEPRSLSFNSPYGACQICQGLGKCDDSPLCLDCQGCRVGPAGRAVRLGGAGVLELSRMSVRDAVRWCTQVRQSLSANSQAISRLLDEVESRLSFLDRVGVGYLSLGRDVDSLSGGELQRVRLAASLGAGLTNTCIVLDEPSIGLHPRDTNRLIDVMHELRDAGNTLIVVEHDESIMRQADWLIDLGPGAGQHGGRIIAAGTPQALAQSGIGATAKFLAGEALIRRQSTRRSPAPTRWLELVGATGHNLRNVTLRVPLGLICAVTGVSGSGKSTLINQTLAPAVQQFLNGTMVPASAPYHQLHGADQVGRVVVIDQLPIGRSGRSCPATYCGIFDDIRKLFAATKEARRLGFSPSRFSFNSRAGACPECQGHGQKRIPLQFLPDLLVTCTSCQGRRFNQQTLGVRFRGLSIADVLELSVEQALGEFSGFQRIYRVLKTLSETGLGYLRLGQPATTLSGGEAQRIKLSKELALPEHGQTLYILDEPTTGLHPSDVQRILDILDQLAANGNTVVIIEHDLDLIRNADWVIDLGPEGGDAGGEIMAAGPPESLAIHPLSHTGRCLRQLVPGSDH